MTRTRTRIDRHVNGQLKHKKQFQADLITTINNGARWPADVACSLGWHGTQKERTVIHNEMAQLVRLGLIAPPLGYTVTAEGVAFAEKYGTDNPSDAASDQAEAGQVVPPTVPKPVTRELTSPSRAPARARPAAPEPKKPGEPEPAYQATKHRRF